MLRVKVSQRARQHRASIKNMFALNLLNRCPYALREVLCECGSVHETTHGIKERLRVEHLTRLPHHAFVYYWANSKR
jgi:hypothetical protein